MGAAVEQSSSLETGVVEMEYGVVGKSAAIDIRECSDKCRHGRLEIVRIRWMARRKTDQYVRI